MKPVIKQFFIEATQNDKKFKTASDQYIEYMDTNLRTLKGTLSPCNFDLVFPKLWETGLIILTEMINYGINVSFLNSIL